MIAEYGAPGAPEKSKGWLWETESLDPVSAGFRTDDWLSEYARARPVHVHGFFGISLAAKAEENRVQLHLDAYPDIAALTTPPRGRVSAHPRLTLLLTLWRRCTF